MDITDSDHVRINKENELFQSKWRYSDAARHLQVSEEFLRQAVMKRKIPFIKIGRCVRFDPVQIEIWLKSHTIKPEDMQ